MGQHPGLARAGAGEDQQRSLAVDDGLPLRLVEPGEQALSPVGPGFDRRPAVFRRGLGVHLQHRSEHSLGHGRPGR